MFITKVFCGGWFPLSKDKKIISLFVVDPVLSCCWCGNKIKVKCLVLTHKFLLHVAGLSAKPLGSVSVR
jgi:hypothetical protein